MMNLTRDFALEDRSMNSIGNTFLIGDLKGFHAKLSPNMLLREKRSYDVEYIEANQRVYASQACHLQSTTEWGLDRISEVQLKLDGAYHYTASGAGVDAYIVDTGILITHVDFGGRASWGNNFVGDGINNDCNGHGTHVAGTTGGTAYGVAKDVSLIAVKVLGCTGSGSTAGVISGVDYVAAQADRTGKPSLANLSLGGGISTTMDAAVKSAVASGVTFVLAAGNSNADACTSSPARTGGSAGVAITVGATTVANSGISEEDARASFSNYGTCTDIFAPGQLITSDWYTSNTATNTISGTSMAAPHVAGAVAVYLSENPSHTPAQVKGAITGVATNGVIDLLCINNSCSNSPNRLLFSGC